MFYVHRKNACTNPVTGKLIRVKQKNFRFFLNQIISAWKQTLMMVEITTLVDTVLLTESATLPFLPTTFGEHKNHQSINQFSGPAYPWGVAGAAAQVGASKHSLLFNSKIRFMYIEKNACTNPVTGKLIRVKQKIRYFVCRHL